MSTFNKEYDGLADAIITNAIVMPAVELNEGEKFPPYYYTDNAAWDTGAQFTFISPRERQENKICIPNSIRGRN